MGTRKEMVVPEPYALSIANSPTTRAARFKILREIKDLERSAEAEATGCKDERLHCGKITTTNQMRQKSSDTTLTHRSCESIRFRKATG
jgi:hypothetical protein